ncbi:hypothetical protein [Leptospira noguchii]|uniref:Uncharacterized protein n=1 Tax=Leptospira noguchii TaxID=28182 RepID=A0AAE9GI43_9LEPT|nr:hypothetical protein [Leptospira noguchii]UOG51604.1 hypothetical protein MAL09_12995 [Leptospira noguchii]UOG57729.1 hypothetical protein MAL03_06260 [Leptospira noguchii]
MLRSVVSSIEFEKFRRNWSEKNSAQRFPECLSLERHSLSSLGRVALSLLFAPIFLRRTHFILLHRTYIIKV